MLRIEYFRSAVGWLGRQDGIAPGALAVLGGSRGGELALLIGATFPEIRAVVAYVPSGVRWEGMGEPGKRPASWTVGGQARPFLRRRDDAIDWKRTPIELTPGLLAALRDELAVSEAAIPVERTEAALLLLSGEDDRMWPSARLAEIAMERLRQKDFRFPAEHLTYAGAGHLLISPPNLPATVDRARHPIRVARPDRARAARLRLRWVTRGRGRRAGRRVAPGRRLAAALPLTRPFPTPHPALSPGGRGGSATCRGRGS